jgi:type I restriction enzyme R subunit
VILKDRFKAAVKQLNLWLTDDQLEEVYAAVSSIDHPDPVIKSKLFYDMLVAGVKLVIKESNEERTRLVKLIDFDEVKNNMFLAANQFTVEYQYKSGLHRRPDLVVFVNGLPLAIFEFKSFNANETARDAFDDHRNKKNDIPQLYVYAQVLVASDGHETKYGSRTSDWDKFFVWEGILDDDDIDVKKLGDESYEYFYKGQKMTSLEIIIKGLFERTRFAEFVQDFVYFEKSGETYDIKIAMFHQFYVVKKALEGTKRAVVEGKRPGDRRVGVVWHTQGSGKSLTMLYYARKALKAKELEYPILLFLTDRNNLDEQLSSNFAELPIAKQAESIKELQELIKTTAGGIIFATIQKFGKRKADEYPFLTDRRNIVIVADEAHRTQYKELAQNLRTAIPNAAFIGFTATPIEYEDRSTTLVFGKHLSIYSMEKARRHGVVVPIFYDARLSELHLTNEFIDEEFENLSESIVSDPDVKEALKKKFGRVEELVIAEDRLRKIARDIIDHFNERTQEFKGKALVVTVSRKAAVKLYEEMNKLPNAPPTVVVMSGNRHDSPAEYWPHLRSKEELRQLADDFRNPGNNPQVAIVVDMWLTGFDAPCLNTMYFDKPMKDHSLVQAITRVDRVFKDKPGGLIVDYIGIADSLRKSLAMYTAKTISDTLVKIEEVIRELEAKHAAVVALFQGIDYQQWRKLSPTDLSRVTTIAYDRICQDEETKKKFVRNFIALKKLFALASPHPEASAVKSDVIFFEMIKKMVVKYSTARIRDVTRDLEYEVSQLISRSISAEEPVDVFALAGKRRANISILDETLLDELTRLPYKNYAAEVLAKIAKDQLVVMMRRNPHRYRTLYEILTAQIDKYNVKLISAPEIIEQLVKIAADVRKKFDEGKKLNVTEAELAFYDLLSTNEKLFENYEQIRDVAKQIAKELGPLTKVADWNRKEYLKARIRTALKNVLMKAIDGRGTYPEIEKLSVEVMTHAESVYNVEQEVLAAVSA